MLNRAGVAARIPHAGAMCLLDGVTQWDPHGIVATAVGHGAPDHPLREGDRLPAWAAIEYAAQAAAVHGSLLLTPSPAPSNAPHISATAIPPAPSTTSRCPRPAANASPAASR